MRILIVDDNTNNYLLMAQLLNAAGIQVEPKYSGLNIVSYLDKHPNIDLILMDIHMPIVDGPTALQKLRAAQRNIRVVAVTADAGPPQMQQARDWGFDGFIAKPIRPEVFAESIRAICNGQAVWDSGG